MCFCFPKSAKITSWFPSMHTSLAPFPNPESPVDAKAKRLLSDKNLRQTRVSFVVVSARVAASTSFAPLDQSAGVFIPGVEKYINNDERAVPFWHIERENEKEWRRSWGTDDWKHERHAKAWSIEMNLFVLLHRLAQQYGNNQLRQSLNWNLYQNWSRFN